jgi:hypothetical protein
MGNVGFSWGELRERDHSGDLGVGGRRKIKWIFTKFDGEAWNGLL